MRGFCEATRPIRRFVRSAQTGIALVARLVFAAADTGVEVFTLKGHTGPVTS